MYIKQEKNVERRKIVVCTNEKSMDEKKRKNAPWPAGNVYGKVFSGRKSGKSTLAASASTVGHGWQASARCGRSRSRS